MLIIAIEDRRHHQYIVLWISSSSAFVAIWRAFADDWIFISFASESFLKVEDVFVVTNMVVVFNARMLLCCVKWELWALIKDMKNTKVQMRGELESVRTIRCVKSRHEAK